MPLASPSLAGSATASDSGSVHVCWEESISKVNGGSDVKLGFMHNYFVAIRQQDGACLYCHWTLGPTISHPLPLGQDWCDWEAIHLPRYE